MSAPQASGRTSLRPILSPFLATPHRASGLSSVLTFWMVVVLLTLEMQCLQLIILIQASDLLLPHAHLPPARRRLGQESGPWRFQKIMGFPLEGCCCLQASLFCSARPPAPRMEFCWDRKLDQTGRSCTLLGRQTCCLCTPHTCPPARGGMRGKGGEGVLASPCWLPQEAGHQK